MKNELIILVVSASLLVVVNQAYALENSGWGDARDFWRMLDGVENYYGKYFAEDDFNDKDESRFNDFELTVKIVSYEKKTPSLVISTNGEEKIIPGHALNDGSEKVRFFLDTDDLNKKVSIKVKGKQWEITKSFKTNRDKATVEFYYKEGGRQ